MTSPPGPLSSIPACAGRRGGLRGSGRTCALFLESPAHPSLALGYGVLATRWTHLRSSHRAGQALDVISRNPSIIYGLVNLSPLRKKSYRFRLFPFRSPLLRELGPRLRGNEFFSVPLATKMFHFARYASHALYIQAWMTCHFRQAGLPHSDIPGSKVGCHLPEAYRRLRRPSSFIGVKAFTIRPYCSDVSSSRKTVTVFRDERLRPEPPTSLAVRGFILNQFDALPLIKFSSCRYLERNRFGSSSDTSLPASRVDPRRCA